jgi:hypothetical protein
MNTQLLLTFTNYDSVESTVDQIQDNYKLLDNRIFVLKNAKNQKDFFLTYNIIKESYKSTLIDTISVHRKKETNTIYTINAVNTVILQKVGVMDTTFQINWNEYRNSLLLTNEYGIKVTPTKLDRIIEI